MNRHAHAGQGRGLPAIMTGSAGIICEICGHVADSETEHRTPGPMTTGIADKVPTGPWRARCYSHGSDRCWTAWKAEAS